MPQESHPIYWLAGRRAIFTYCKAAAPQIRLVAIIEVVLNWSQVDIGGTTGYKKQFFALSKVFSDISALYYSDSLNDLLRTVVDAILNMIQKWNRWDW